MIKAILMEVKDYNKTEYLTVLVVLYGLDVCLCLGLIEILHIM